MSFIDVYYAICLVFGFFAGAALGSGIACLLMRSAAKESWAKGRSHCDSCGHVLGVRDLIPIFSYAFSRGRCRHCGARIPVLCLVTEIAFGLVGLAMAMWFVFPYDFLLIRIWLTVISLIVAIFTSYECVRK